MYKRNTSRGKRQRTGPPAFGEASEADSPLAQNNLPTSSALCTRDLSPTSVPALTTLCARVFVANLMKLANGVRTKESTRHWLKILPDVLVPKIFAMLRKSCPSVLNNSFIVAYFLRGPSIVLTSDLPEIKKSTISAIASNGSAVQHLELSGFVDFPDTLFASTLESLTSLRILILRGCSNVGPKTAMAAAKSCPLLTTVNFNYTTVTPVSLVPLVNGCPHLEVLKVAGIQNWTDATFAKFLAGVVPQTGFKLETLHTLKLRQTALSDLSLQSFIALCPNLRRLDISFTPVLHPPSPLTNKQTSLTALQKLCLTSTQVSNVEVLAVISGLPQLTTLLLGAMGERQGSSATMGNTSALTMNNDFLARLTNVLEDFRFLEAVSLVGNAKLGLTEKSDGALSGFIGRIGRKCKSLNLGGIPSLHSSELAGLVPDTVEQGPPELRTLVLNYTNVDDDAAPFISSCEHLETLKVGSTKFTSAGLFPIIDACTKLEKLDLTSCRGVKVVDRRRFFEVWEKEWKGS